MGVRLWALVALVALFVLFACSETSVSPSPVTTTAPADIEPPKPPRVDQPFEFRGNIGFSLFAGARASEDEIREVFATAKSSMSGRPWSRVCAEVQSWGGRPYLPRGASAHPFDESAPAYLELKSFLDVTATIPGAQVLVVGICTLKEDGTSPQDRERWVRAIARLLNGYQHVALDVVNEFKHPNSSISEKEAIHLVRVARQEFRGLTSLDTNIHPSQMRYSATLRPLVDIPFFHPWRNPNPTRAELQRLRDLNGPYVLTETVAFNDSLNVDPSCSGLRTCRMGDVEQLILDCRAVDGCEILFHSIWGLGWPELPIGAFPIQ